MNRGSLRISRKSSKINAHSDSDFMLGFKNATFMRAYIPPKLIVEIISRVRFTFCLLHKCTFGVGGLVLVMVSTWYGPCEKKHDSKLEGAMCS